VFFAWSRDLRVLPLWRTGLTAHNSAVIVGQCDWPAQSHVRMQLQWSWPVVEASQHCLRVDSSWFVYSCRQNRQAGYFSVFTAMTTTKVSHRCSVMPSTGRSITWSRGIMFSRYVSHCLDVCPVPTSARPQSELRRAGPHQPR